MNSQDDRVNDAADLRRQAEAKLASLELQNLEVLSPEATRQMFHELRVHQIELTMQNEELHRTQVELDVARARYFDLYDLAPVGYLTVSEKGMILEANLTAATLLGVTRGALVKQFFFQFILKEDQDIYYRHRKQLFATGAPQACDLRMLKKDETVFWVRFEAITALDADDAPVSRVVMSDITKGKLLQAELQRSHAELKDTVGRLQVEIIEHKKAREGLLESEERYRSLFHNSHSVMLLIDPKTGCIADTNFAACEYYGFSMEELKAKKISDINVLPPEQVLQEMQRATAEERKQFEFRHRLANGKIRDVDVFSGPIRFKDKDLLYSIVHDVTARKQAEEAFRASKEIFEKLVRSLSVPLCFVNKEGVLIYFNDRFAKVFGYTPEDIPTLKEWWQLAYPDEHYRRWVVATWEAAVEKAAEEEIDIEPIEYKVICKNGAERIVEISGISIEDNFLATFIDVTERRQAEAKLKASLAEKEVLLKEIHHRVKNNLQIVIGLLNMQSRFITYPLVKELLQDCQTRIRSMALVHEVLYRSKNLSEINLHEYLTTLINGLVKSYQKDGQVLRVKIEVANITIKIETAIPCGLIMTELVSNALKHAFCGNRDGELYIAASRLSDSEIALVVRDNGVSIPVDVDLTKVDTLGLRLVTDLAQHQLNGKLILKREHGTEFQINFKEPYYKKRI